MAGVLSSLYWLTVAVIAVLLFPVAVIIWALTAPFDRRKVVLHALTNVWGSLYTWIIRGGRCACAGASTSSPTPSMLR